MTSLTDGSRRSRSIGPYPSTSSNTGLHERLSLVGVEREPLLCKRSVQLLLDLLADVGLRHALVVEDRTQLLDHELVHLLAEIFERVRAR